MGRRSPRSCGQGLDYAVVEYFRVIGVENPAHREEMLERFLLQCPHHLMRLVDRLGDARSIAMLGFDRLREPDVGGAHLEFERLAATGEVGFDPLEFPFLLRGQVKLTRSEEHTSELTSLMRR